MQLEYVDVVFANRPDSNTPMEGESVYQDFQQHPVMKLIKSAVVHSVWLSANGTFAVIVIVCKIHEIVA